MTCISPAQLNNVKFEHTQKGYSEGAQKGTYDKSWKGYFGLNAMAVTAPTCPRKTEIGYPSGKRH